jgi:hypothetical protein
MAQEVKATTFTSVDGKTTLVVQHRHGKEGHHTSVSLRVENAKAQLGCRTHHNTDVDATKAYDVLVKQAAENGWKLKKSAGDGIKTAFTSIPKASK